MSSADSPGTPVDAPRPAARPSAAWLEGLSLGVVVTLAVLCIATAVDYAHLLSEREAARMASGRELGPTENEWVLLPFGMLCMMLSWTIPWAALAGAMCLRRLPDVWRVLLSVGIHVLCTVPISNLLVHFYLQLHYRGASNPVVLWAIQLLRP